MSIQRAPRPDSGFTLILDEVLRDSRLSYRARGVLVAVLSRPDNWVTTAVQLATEGKEGREAIRAALSELEEAGYIERRRVRGERGLWSTQTIVYDRPRTDEQTTDAQPAEAVENAGSPAPENPSDAGSRASVSRQSVSRASRSTTEKKTKDEEPSSSPTADAADDQDTSDPDATAKKQATEPQRDDVDRLCAYLADRIEQNGSKRPTITVEWRRQCRLLLDADGREEQQVRTAITWCQNDPFWMANIRSMPKLREQYDTLRLRAIEQARAEVRTATAARQRHTDQRFDAAMERARARDEANGTAHPDRQPQGVLTS